MRRDDLVEVVYQEFMRLVESVNDKKKPSKKEKRKEFLKKYDMERDIDVFPGMKELTSLSHGIAEKKSEKKDCKGYNKNHDELGKFSSQEDAAVWAGGYTGRDDCKYGKWKYPGGKTKYMTRHPCGRKDDGSKEKYRCKDGEQVAEDRILNGDQHEQCRDAFSEEEMDELVQEFELSLVERTDNRAKQLRKACSRIGYMSFRDFLVKMDFIKRAEDGKLFKK